MIYNQGAKVHSSHVDEPMRPKSKKRVRRATQPRDRRHQANEEAAEAKAFGRLLTTLYRKEGGSVVVKLSELTLRRLAADETSVSRSEREIEIQSNLLALLDRHGVVNHRVIRRNEDRLRIIKRVLDECVENCDIETIERRREVTYRLSARQMKQQARADKEREQRIRTRREERTITKRGRRPLTSAAV